MDGGIDCNKSNTLVGKGRSMRSMFKRDLPILSFPIVYRQWIWRHWLMDKKYVLRNVAFRNSPCRNYSGLSRTPILIEQIEKQKFYEVVRT